MTLSVIIVNYNVKFLLEKCLRSVLTAGAAIETEIIVIDNNSSDGSLQYLTPLFPSVKFILNQHNPGFAKACNQGLHLASGEFILFLNPDTIVASDCFEKCVATFKENANIGAVGVKMVDGNGCFLKESKRSLPTPATALFKLFGFSYLFPKSKIFSKYSLGYINENACTEVDVLCGAFMMIRKKILNDIGGFDEAFFMYGEDIDLSYRIQRHGYKNYYLGTVQIVHFKGESTNKNSTKYIRLFYGAMVIFVDKYYNSTQRHFYKLLLYAGVRLSATFAIIKLKFKQLLNRPKL